MTAAPSEKAPRPRRRRWQFSLRFFLAFVTLAAVGLGWWFRPFTVEEAEGGLDLRLTYRRDWRGNIVRDGPMTGKGIVCGVPATVVGHYRDAKREGIWQVDSDAGQLLAQTSFRRDRRHGPEAEWYPNGSKRFEATFIEDQPDGQMTDWDAEGRIAMQGVYREGAPWSGVCFQYWSHGWIEYYENGAAVPLEPSDERAALLKRAIDFHYPEVQPAERKSE